MRKLNSILLLCFSVIVMTACQKKESTEIMVSWYSSWMYPLEDSEVLISYRRDGNQVGENLTSTLNVRTINEENGLSESSRRIFEGDRIEVIETNKILLVQVNDDPVCCILEDGSICDSDDKVGEGLRIYFTTVSLVNLNSE